MREAIKLYALGFNIFSMPRGKKEPYAGFKWTPLKPHRLHYDPTSPYHPNDLRQVFLTPCNIAVVTGRTSGNLFVIDCETQAAFTLHIRMLRERGIPLWAVRTARGGHIYLRSNSGEVQNIASGTIPDLEVRGNSNYVLAPPSVHPTGAIYQWFQREGDYVPVVSLSAIDWLRDGDGNPVALTTKRQRSKRESSPFLPRTRAYLANGFAIPEGAREVRAFEAVCDLAANGYSQTDAYKVIQPIASASGLPEKEILHAIETAYSKPRNSIKHSHNQTHVDKRVAAAAAFAAQHDWRRRTGSTDRRVFEALIERARLGIGAKGVFRATQREIAEVARFSYRYTVQRSLSRLQQQEFIRRCSKAGSSSLWAFGKLVLQHKLPQPDTFLRENDLVVMSPLSTTLFSDLMDSLPKPDAAELTALGDSGYRVYRALLTFESDASVVDIAARATLSVWQVRQALCSESWLQRAGLVRFKVVERGKKVYSAVPATNDVLDELIAAPPRSLCCLPALAKPDG
jgi:hypothetical protein